MATPYNRAILFSVCALIDGNITFQRRAAAVAANATFAAAVAAV